MKTVNELIEYIDSALDDGWSYAEIAQFAKVSTATARRMTLQTGFPAPKVLPTSEDTTMTRWSARDVRHWFSRLG